MEITVPWEAFLALIEPVYHKPSSKGGRPPIPLEVMLRIHLLQQWFTLSDPLMEEMLIDTPCFRRFAGIEPMEGRIPDETTILNFRHLLEKHRIAEQILEGVNEMLRKKGVMMREGTILDATIINAPCSTKNKRKERDPEMHSVAKGDGGLKDCPQKREKLKITRLSEEPLLGEANKINIDFRGPCRCFVKLLSFILKAL